MNSQVFKNVISAYHAYRFSRMFGLNVAGNNGIDLLGKDLGIELKCRSDRWHLTWPVHYEQVDKFPSQQPDKTLYWAFLLYNFRTPVSTLDPGTPLHHLGLYVRNPQVWFLPWDWIRPFPVSRTPKASYIYVHRGDLPPSLDFQSVTRNEYQLHLPKGLDLERLVQRESQPAKLYRLKV
ncbi:MAG TPA: hypothetical protein VJG90_08550 [Candidatus Nanoarchaeia archaeon]|nr:hypothetical protein [Candidatus Nanoarchaeia archaeon]